MSYCRWSCDKFQSDVYAYEDCTGGYTIHVAEVHPVSVEHIPEFEPLKWLEEGTVGENHSKYMDAVKQIEYKKIGLMYDGETLHASDIYDLKEKLEWLKQVGYHVPESAFEMIWDEIHGED